MNAFGITHRGAVRNENQDRFRYSLMGGGELLTAVLCDGMGGAQAGSGASTIASDTFMSHAANSLDESSTPSDMHMILTEAVNYANIKVYDRAFADFSCMGMGSTLVGMLINGKRASVVNVGDSRAYLISRRSRRIVQITRDHSLVEELLEYGAITQEEARVHPQKNIITRALGAEAEVEADYYPFTLKAGGILLLCSDGLSNTVSDDELLAFAEENPDPETLCRKLMDCTLERGAKDNVTVVAVAR
jgi:protein phosphatase